MLGINNFKVHIQSFETGDDSNRYKCTGGMRAHIYKRQGIEANRYIICVNSSIKNVIFQLPSSSPSSSSSVLLLCMFFNFFLFAAAFRLAEIIN